MATVLIPLPELDFDPTEVAVSWKLLVGLGHRVRFATPEGRPARGDGLMVTGRGLDPWGFVPGLSSVVGVGRILRADARGRAAYGELMDAGEFQHPHSWGAIDLDRTDGVLLPGGHRSRGMRAYLESEALQGVVVESFRRGLPVAAVCHGVLLAARSIDPGTGRSVLHGRTTTALTWSLERRAWQVARVTRFWDPDYYRTYREEPGQPVGFLSAQQEVTRALAGDQDFLDVDPAGPDVRIKQSGRARDTPDDERPAFVVQDGNYLSARWPGDVHTLARRFASVLEQSVPDGPIRRGEEPIPS
jgi:putative intracellular protease/amidase